MASKKHVTVTWSFSTWSFFLLTIRNFSKIRNFIISSWITVVLLALSRNWLANQFRTRFLWSDLSDRFWASVPKIELQLCECRILSFQKARRDFQRVRRFFALLPFLRGKVITISKKHENLFFRWSLLYEIRGRNINRHFSGPRSSKATARKSRISECRNQISSEMQRYIGEIIRTHQKGKIITKLNFHALFRISNWIQTRLTCEKIGQRGNLTVTKRIIFCSEEKFENQTELKI